jgi:hypothetical protein
MSKKMTSLQQALNHNAAAPAKPKAVPSPAPTNASSDATESPPATRSPSRVGKETISAWLHPDFKKGLRLVQVRKEGKVYLDDLMAEALNDLFQKYDVPTVSHN